MKRRRYYIHNYYYNKNGICLEIMKFRTWKLNRYFQKPISGLLIFLLLLPSLLIPAAVLVTPQKAEALVPITKPLMPVQCALLDIECVRDWILKTLLKAATDAVLRAATNSVISWIQGGGGNFVQNLEEELGRQLNLIGGEFLNRLAGINLCGNIGAFLQITLRGPGGKFGGLNQQFSCTLTGIVNNIEGLFTNLNSGGWDAFFRMTYVPTQNYYGAYLLAQESLFIAQKPVQESILSNFLAGKGFLGIQDCQKIPDGDMDLNGNATYYTKCRTTTPGATVAAALEKAAVDTPFERIINSQEISDMVNAIFNALIQATIQKVMTGIF